MPPQPPPDNVRCHPRSASTSSANDVAGIDLGTWSRNHALSSLRNASSAGVNDRSTLRTCPPNAGAVNSYRDVALGRSPHVSDHADDDAGGPVPAPRLVRRRNRAEDGGPRDRWSAEFPRALAAAPG